jgi:FlaA1/EpsC-like NDP-sugar epimerase
LPLRFVPAPAGFLMTLVTPTDFHAVGTEATQLVLQAATLGFNGEVHMLDMGHPVNITMLARRLIEMSGLRPGDDIEIRFVGVRPGEKLQEHLWTDSAVVTPTSFPRVLSIQPPPPNEDFDKYLHSLEAAALTRDDELARKAMMEMPINYTWEPPTGAASKSPATVKPLAKPSPTSLELAGSAHA